MSKTWKVHLMVVAVLIIMLYAFEAHGLLAWVAAMITAGFAGYGATDWAERHFKA